MNFPSDLLYTRDHEWVRIEGTVGTVGITDFAQKELGDIVFIDIQTVGKSLKAQDVFGVIEAVKTVSDLFLPLDGTILTFNEALNNAPETVNTDPYGDGWLVKVELGANPNLSELLNAEAYQALINA